MYRSSCSFPQISNRWDGSHEKEFCSEQVKIVYSAFYSTINELGAKASALQKHSVTGHLVERVRSYVAILFSAKSIIEGFVTFGLIIGSGLL